MFGREHTSGEATYQPAGIEHAGATQVVAALMREHPDKIEGVMPEGFGSRMNRLGLAERREEQAAQYLAEAAWLRLAAAHDAADAVEAEGRLEAERTGPVA